MSNKPRYALVSPEAGRNLTADLWRSTLVDHPNAYPEHGVDVKDDFTDYLVASGTGTAVVTGNYSVDREAADANGTVTADIAAGPDGELVLASSTSTAHNGVSLQALPKVITSPLDRNTANRRGRVVFEARVNFGTAAVAFVGLSEAGDQFLGATSGVPTTGLNFAGFRYASGALTFHLLNDKNAVTDIADSFAVPAAALDSGAWHRLGFAINADGTVDIAVDGRVYQKAVNKLSKAAIFEEPVSLRVSATTGAGTTPPSVSLDFYRVVVEGVNP